MLTGGAGNTPGVHAGPLMGLKLLGRPPGGNSGIFAFTYADLNAPKRRLRPSHMASVPVSVQVSKTRNWVGHYMRWGDDRMVPIPFRRGVRTSGDRLGSGNLVLSALG